MNMPSVNVAGLVILAAGTCGLSAQVTGERPPRGTISIEAFGPFGGRLERPTIHLFTLDRKQDLARDRHALTLKEVPYGRYLPVVTSTGGGVGSREIVVNAPHSWFVIGVPMPVGTVEWPAGNLTVRGRVMSPPFVGGFWWVRIAGVFTNTSREARVKRDGSFEIGGLEMGAYTVSVFDGGQLKYVKKLELDTNRRITEVSISEPCCVK